MMRDHLHWLIDEYEGSIQKVIDAGDDWQLEAYLAYWLAGLFVVVEGFNKLKLRDPRVQRLFQAHLGDLKELRHETYHFTLSRIKGAKAIRSLNWAEELHEAIGGFIREHITRKMHVEHLQEFRAKKRAI